MALIKNFLLESISNINEFDADLTLSKLKNSEKIDSIKSNSVGFVLEETNDETNETQLIKIYVVKSEAEEFEKALSTLLNEYNGKKEVAEIIFSLRSRFNIINVEYPSIQEDEEIEQEISDTEQPENTLDNTSDDFNLNQQNTTDIDNNTEIKSILQSIIDMMKADAEAKKAEAEAKISQHASTTALAKIKTEEELIDMENYYKEKEEKRKEIEKLAKLAKYKQDLKNDEILNNENDFDNILNKTNNSYENEEIKTDFEHLSNIDIFFKHNQSQR